MIVGADMIARQYSDKLGVHIEQALGYMYISAPPNEGFRYATCAAAQVAGQARSVVRAKRSRLPEGPMSSEGTGLSAHRNLARRQSATMRLRWSS